VKEGLIAKSVTEKNNEGWIVRKPTKRPCKPCTSASSVTVGHKWADEKGRGFLAAGDCPAELPVINLQAKPDLWLLW